jgi:hypothetical protein
MALRRLRERIGARKIIRWYRLIKKMIIIKRKPAKGIQAQYKYLAITKI